MRPLILVREGSQLYLKSALLTAIESGNEVILIGDKSNKSFCDDWVDVSSIAKDILPCWDMLKKMDDFILCDSDLFVFSNLSNKERT